VITIPPPPGTAGPAAPTGVTANKTKGFVVTKAGTTGPVSAPSQLIFVTEDGTISGWNPKVDPANAALAVDRSSTGAVYKGATLAKASGKTYLYVANFHDGDIEVYDKKFTPVTKFPFSDPSIPAGFAPFDVQLLNGKLYVTYAKQDAARHDDVAGPGNGVVDVFSTKGKLLHRFATGGTLNSPWGLTIAPKNFKAFKNDILVGNFGDGAINVFNKKGDFKGQLTDSAGHPIVIDGLWALNTGNGTNAGRNTVYFTSGPDHETHGLFGKLTVAQVSETSI
jgi:uncharacterized protein (TIGR03118 family)